VAYDNKVKEQARSLRSQGKTYSEILKVIKLDIPKSTISGWCSNIELPQWYQNKIDELNKSSLTKAQKMSLVANNAKRERIISEIVKEAKIITKSLKDKNMLKVILAILYLGEGSKWKSHRGLSLGSSDPTIIKLYISLLRLCYGISVKSLRCRISYRADQSINDLQKFWSHVTSIHAKNFYKTIPDPRTVGKPTRKKDYKGVCVITCAGTHIQLELQAIPDLVLKEITGR